MVLAMLKHKRVSGASVASRKRYGVNLATGLCALIVALTCAFASPARATSISCPGSFEGELRDGGGGPGTDVLTFTSVQKFDLVRLSWLRTGSGNIDARSTPDSNFWPDFSSKRSFTSSYTNVGYYYQATSAASSATITLDATELAGEDSNRSVRYTVICQRSMNGSVVLSPDPFKVGRPVTVEVTDSDHNDRADFIETVSVTLLNKRTSEKELLAIKETGVNTGIFSGNLRTASGQAAGTSGDGSINVLIGDELSVDYLDNQNVQLIFRSITVTDTATAFAGADSAITIAPRPSKLEPTSPSR